MSVYAPKTPKRFNLVSVLMTLAVAGLVYVGWWYLPHYYAAFQLSSIMKTVCYEAYRNHDDEALKVQLLRESARTGLPVTRESITIVREPWAPERLAALPIEGRRVMERRGSKIWISVEVAVDAKWPLSEKVTRLNFRRTQSTDLETIKW